jgi:hypothetical protein
MINLKRRFNDVIDAASKERILGVGPYPLGAVARVDIGWSRLKV